MIIQLPTLQYLCATYIVLISALLQLAFVTVHSKVDCMHTKEQNVMCTLANIPEGCSVVPRGSSTQSVS